MTGPLGALMHGIRDSFGLEITRSEVKAQVDAKNGRSEWNVFVFSWWEIGVSSGQKWIRRRASLERTSSEVRFVLINAASESTSRK